MKIEAQLIKTLADFEGFYYRTNSTITNVNDFQKVLVSASTRKNDAHNIWLVRKV